MTITANKPAVVAAVIENKVTCKGKGKAQRELAFTHIATDTYVAENNRALMVATITLALGTSPTADELAHAKREFVIGRAASRMPEAEFPKGTIVTARDETAMNKLQHVRALWNSYAAPSKAKDKAPKLPTGKTGWRTEMQQRVIRNAEEAWSQVLAETGHGKAQTQDQRNAAKRAPSAAGSGKGKAKAAAPTHAQLVKPEAPTSADAACDYLLAQGKMLLDYANKHAGVLPLPFGDAVHKFYSALTAASAERTLAKGDAKAASAKPRKTAKA